MKQQDTSRKNHVMVLTPDEIYLLRKALNMLDDSLEADIDKSIDILNEVIGDDDDKTLEYFRVYQKRLRKELTAIQKISGTLRVRGVQVTLKSRW
tara:strand:- start:59 stop:343 length:285 start_codon:yes stop_codon:yes gene_type:complete